MAKDAVKERDNRQAIAVKHSHASPTGPRSTRVLEQRVLDQGNKEKKRHRQSKRGNRPRSAQSKPYTTQPFGHPSYACNCASWLEKKPNQSSVKDRSPTRRRNPQQEKKQCTEKKPTWKNFIAAGASTDASSSCASSLLVAWRLTLLLGQSQLQLGTWSTQAGRNTPQ